MRNPNNPKEGDWTIRNQAKKQFYDFVIQTYQKLYDLETRQLCAKSSISIFCRFDIGLIEKENKVYYFVNEVERTQTASLWTNSLKTTGTNKSRIGLFGSTFATVLYKWLQDISNPFFDL